MPPFVIRDPIPERIVLIRHGQTPWSISGRHTGRTDIPLDERGEELARALGERLAEVPFARSYSSPLGRARMTASLAGFDDPILLDDLVEWDYGSYEGVTTVEIHRTDPSWLLWRDGCPSGETAADVGRRADRVIDRIVEESSPDDAVAVFGHGHMLRELGARWLGLAPEDGRLFCLDTSSICELGFEHHERVFRSWNT